MQKHLAVSLAILLYLLAMVSCSSRHVAAKPDTTVPAILSTYPASNAAAVTVTTAITCTFSEAMNASTINDASFLLVSMLNTTTTTVAGTVTYDASTHAATFTPFTALEHGTVYTVTITPDVTDSAGNKISAAVSWSFTTIPSPGALDSTFGSGGRVMTAIGISKDEALAVAVQQDGKIVTAGYSILTSSTTTAASTTTTTDYYFTIARYQSTGSLDSTFGFFQNGWTDVVTGIARGVAMQSDGKIVAAGETNPETIITVVTSSIPVVTTSANTDFMIARFDANGMLDTTFGPQSNGTVTMDMGYDHDVVRSLALQADGKIVVAGEGINSGSLDFASLIARFNADGTLDSTFANGGKLLINTIGTTSRARVVKIQSDGKIIVGGNFKDGSGPASFYLVRYDMNGTPDASFNAGMVTASPGTDPELVDIAILSDGKIVIAGTTNGSSNADVFLMRYNADGTLDTTFGSAGTVITDDLLHGKEMAAGLAIQADGKIIVSATYQPTTGTILDREFSLFRYDANGGLDTTFGDSFGMVFTNFGSANDDFANAVQIQQDGKIVVVGTSSNSSHYDLGLTRYWP